MQNVIPCRLCGADSERVFELPILGKYPVSYFECRKCGGIETEEPYWLAEAYGDDVHPEDKGYLKRNLLVYENMKFLLRELGVPKDAVVLDYGGGLGLIPRLLREDGRNAFNFDTYTKSPFTDVQWDKSKPSFVLAIELFEHLPNPAAEMAEIFAGKPDYVYIRTWRYSGQGKEWSYFGASHGEHVFIYTDEAMRHIARTQGYDVLLPTGVDAVFCREPLSSIKRQIIQGGLRGGRLRKLLDFRSRVLAA